MHAQTQLYCKTCQKNAMHAREQLSAALGLALTLLTGGIFLLFWLIIGVSQGGKPWRCQACGQLNVTQTRIRVSTERGHLLVGNKCQPVGEPLGVPLVNQQSDRFCLQGISRESSRDNLYCCTRRAANKALQPTA